MRFLIMVLTTLLLSSCASNFKNDRGPANFPCGQGMDQANGRCVSNEIESPCPQDIGYFANDKKCYALDTILVPKIYNNSYQDCPAGYQRIGVGVSYDKKNAWVCQLPPPAPAK